MNNEELKKIKKNNFKGYLSQLETVKNYSSICVLALKEYNDLILENDVKATESWLSKYIDLGLLFEEIFDLANYFENEKDALNNDLLLMDESVFGYKITIPRNYFESEIKFKLVFQDLFFDKKILIKELKNYKNSLELGNEETPF